MPRVAVPSFFAGGANRIQIADGARLYAPLDAEDTINRYLELASPGLGQKSPMAWMPVPGLVPYAEVEDSPGRTMFYQDGLATGMTGTTFWQLFPDQTIVVRGTVGNTSNQASIVSNGSAGHQQLICDGHDGYVFDTNTFTFTQINNTTFPGTGFPYGNALAVEFIDGYGIVVQRESRRFFISALEDFTSWDPLDVFERSEGSDNLAGVLRNGRELWFPGTLTGEVWYDSGDALTPFQPVPGVFRDSGAASQRALVRFGPENASGSLAWISTGEHGAGTVQLATGYQAQRISTTAVERDLQSVTDVSFSFAFVQQQFGHNFLWLLLPTLRWTWVYDLTISTALGHPVWHKRAMWNPTTAEWEPHLAICHMYAWGDRVGATQ